MTLQEQTSPFLTLPPPIRAQILRKTGLVRPCPIGFKWESSRVLRLHRHPPIRRHVIVSQKCFPDQTELRFRDDWNLGWSFDPFDEREARARREYGGAMDSCRGIYDPLPWCDHGPLPVHLLRVCKLLCSEGTKILYGENAFSLNCYDRRTRVDFLALSDLAVAAMRRLHVIYLPDRNPISWSRQADFERFQRPWEEICRYPLVRITPGQLRLSLECYPRDIATHKRVLAPLSRLPQLRHLHLSMGDLNDRKTEKISTAVARPLLANPSNNKDEPFPFNRLPMELKQLIISHTSLVAVPGAVKNRKRRLANARGIHIEDGRPKPAPGHCCGTCDEAYIWCFCNNRGGDGTFSSSCSCARLSAGLFATSRTMRELADRVFYGDNQLFAGGDSVRQIIRTLEQLSRRNLRRVKRLSVSGRFLLEKNVEETQYLLDYVLCARTRRDIRLKILFTDVSTVSVFSSDEQCDHFTQLSNFKTWFDRFDLHGKRVSVLAPVYYRVEELWGCIAGDRGMTLEG